MIVSIIYTFLIFFIFWGIGVAILRYIPIKLESTPEKYLFGIGFGYVIITNIIFVIGLISIVNQTTMLIIFIISLIISLFSFRHEKPLFKLNENKLKNIRISKVVIVSILFILAIMNLIGALAPPTLADSMNHHFAAPKYYSSINGFPFIPISPWPLPGLIHVLFTKSLILSEPLSCQLIIFIFSILTTLAVYFIAYKYWGSMVGLMASLIYYTLPLTTELSTGAMPEHASNFLSLLSILAILNSFKANKYYSIILLLLSGLLAGSAGATKVWALLGGPSSIIVILYLGYRNSNELKDIFISLTAFSLAYGIILVPWFIRNYISGGDPLWPLGNSFFNTQYFNEISALKYSNWNRGPDGTFLNYLLTPWNLTNNISKYSSGAGAINHFLINPMFLAFIPSAFIFWDKYNSIQKQLFSAICLFSIGIFTIWFLGGYTQPRYLQLIYPGLSIITAVCTYYIFHLKHMYVRYISKVFIGVSISFMVIISLVINLKYIPIFMGFISDNKYLNNMVSHYSSIEWMNNNLPKNSKILYCGYSAWFYLDHDYMPMANHSINYDKIKSSSELKDILTKYKITHIYIEGDPDDMGPAIQEIESGNVKMKDLKINSLEDCDYWLSIDNDSLPFHIVTYHHLRPFILMSGMELSNELELLKRIKTKVVMSRVRGTYKNVEDAVYILN